jgi:serine/threonine protein kinase
MYASTRFPTFRVPENSTPQSAERIGHWKVLRRLQGGAQADVFLVRDLDGLLDFAQRRSAIEQAFSTLTAHGQDGKEREAAVAKLLRVIADVGQEETAAPAVLKRLRSQKAKSRRRLGQEIAVLRKLKHHAIVALLDANLEQGWFTMPYYSGGTLMTHLKDWKNDVEGSLNAIRPVVEALAEVHRLGYVHRDVKPDNVFFNEHGSMVLGDFGLAIEADDTGPRMTSPEERVGSEDWMPQWARMGRLAKLV